MLTLELQAKKICGLVKKLGLQCWSFLGELRALKRDVLYVVLRPRHVRHIYPILFLVLLTFLPVDVYVMLPQTLRLII